MPSYDSSGFRPPAPVARITLRNADTGSVWPDVPMLLDTGADLTLVPRVALERFGIHATADRQYELAGFDGSKSYFAVASLELIFLGRTFRGQYPLIDLELGIIGRSVLNSVRLFFDGPRLTWGEFRQG